MGFVEEFWLVKQWEPRTGDWLTGSSFYLPLQLLKKNKKTTHFTLRTSHWAVIVLPDLDTVTTPTHLLKAYRVTKKLWHFFFVSLSHVLTKGSMWKAFHCGNIVQSLLEKELLCDWEAKLPAKRPVFLIKVPLSVPISAAFFVMDDTKGGKKRVFGVLPWRVHRVTEETILSLAQINTQGQFFSLAFKAFRF